jgi:hypothetical protein
MPNTLRIKRRAAGGASGAPASLANAELAFNEQDSTLYYGTGTGGAGGTATSVIAIGGPGSFAALASPALTGTPTAPTAATNTNTTQLATTAFVLGQGNSTAGTIAMNGTQAAGSSNLYARADHVHPSDTSRAPLASPTFTGVPAAPTATVDTSTTQVATTAFVVGQASATSPVMSGTAAVGTSTRFARADHVHPSDTTKANLASPTFTGVPLAPTAAVDTNTTQIASTAFVLAQASATTPVVNGTAAIGTSTRFARADHVHPTDTSRAPLASPTFTGVPASTTAAVDTNTTQVATTAFVVGQASSTSALALGTAAVGTSLRYARADHVHAMPTLSQVGAATANVSLNNFRITSLADPVSAQDAATKAYVDNVAQGLDAKASVKAATTATITLSGTQTIDGISLIAGDRVLVKNQSTASQNGIYVVSASAWSRSTDMNAWVEVPSAFTFVEQGTTQADTSWVCSADQGGTLDTTAITWVQFGSATNYVAGNGLVLTGNSFAVGATAGRISVTSTAVDIDAAYVGQTSITTLGTVTTGTWNASTIAVGRGGTGATTLTGYVKGSGTSALTASATIPNTDITGLGTMSTQAASNVAITGGSIINLTTFDGVVIDGGTF